MVNAPSNIFGHHNVIKACLSLHPIKKTPFTSKSKGRRESNTIDNLIKKITRMLLIYNNFPLRVK